MFVIRQCETEADYAIAVELAVELSVWDGAETQKLGISADEVSQFYYPTELDLAGSPDAAPGVTLLASERSLSAACIGYREVRPHVCELKRLYVRPAFRGTGLGRTMVSSIVEKATLAGYSRMCLETTHFMKGAISLYDEAGFRPCEPYYEIPEIFHRLSIFMTKDLSRRSGVEQT